MEDNAKQEILEAINAFADQIDGRLGRLESEVYSMKSQMVTKDYLDRKVADLRGELVVLTRKEDVKLSTLVEELVTEGSLSRKTADSILAMEPFAQA
jgi:hypothetical protein